MGDLRHVKKGEPLAIRAQTFNTLIDAAKIVHTGQHNQAAGRPRGIAAPDTVLVRNTTGSDCEQVAPVKLSDPVIDAATNLAEFQSRIAFEADQPAELSNPESCYGEAGHRRQRAVELIDGRAALFGRKA